MNCKHQQVFYASNFIEFQLECLRGNNFSLIDLSIGFKLEGEFVALLPIFFIHKNRELSFLEKAIYPPLFTKNVSRKIEKEISILLIEKLKILFKKFQINEPSISDQIYPSIGLSIWHETILSHSKHCEFIRESFVDLTYDYMKVKSYYRKSYKSLISKGYKIFQPAKLENNEKDIWEEFRALHFKAAGRKTRSDRSWDLLFQEVKKRRYNMYYCRDKNDIMVGSSLIMKTDNEAFYAVAAYDRNLFHLPIGHFLQDFIIKDLLNTKIQWYRLGRLYQKTDFDNPTDKEIQISQFKKGFSSNLIASFRFTDFH